MKKYTKTLANEIEKISEELKNDLRDVLERCSLHCSMFYNPSKHEKIKEEYLKFVENTLNDCFEGLNS